MSILFTKFDNKTKLMYEIVFLPDVFGYDYTNLINGTGNACAWHNRPKLWPTTFSNVKLFDSVENVGAFDPTGSAQ